MLLNKDEQIDFRKITNTYYMASLITKLEGIYFKKYGIVESLNYLYEAILSCKNDVDILLEARKIAGEINNVDQARKSVVGSIFPNSIMYIFYRAKNAGLVPQDLFATTKTKNKLFEDYVTIHVGDETQKPDMDLAFYRLKGDKIKNLIIVSLKTSLRERAGQTYKWKLLLEIASSENAIKDKYNIRFDITKSPMVCFATINFYNEINNPQHRGMFKFFDGSFIGKPLKSDFISNLSELFIFADKGTSE